MKVTFYGHACFAVEIGGKHILFDPFITPNELASHIDVDSIPADYIFLSHGHEDHVADAVSIAKRTGAKVVANYEVTGWINGKGIENAHPMNHGGKWDFDFGTVKMVNAIHTSSMPDGSYGGNPAGFVFVTEEGTFYFAGDTALTYDMKLIGEAFDLDFAVLPIGDNFTMGITDAIKCCEFIGCNKVMGVHFDTFGYIKIDSKAAVQAFADEGLELTLLDIGASTDM